ncbi:MAG: hypothetical protein IJZ56_03475 [Oscillospiraceae bacterium]|nr:hypothetical protein [Oscillospiraceae bacterium]
MAALEYDITTQDWYSGNLISIVYSVSYDPIRNESTVTFGESLHRYYGQSGYQTAAYTTITVTAVDSGNSATSALNTEGTTNGGQQYFYGTPASVTVKHSPAAGAKQITIAASTYAYPIYINGNAHSATGSNSATVTAGTFSTYALSIAAGEGASVEINRTASSIAAAGTLADGDVIYAGDVLQISYSADVEYNVTAATVNGAAIESGGSHTVTGDVAVVIVTELASIVYVGDKVGVLYVYLNGAWHVGLLYAAQGGQFHIGVGYIFLVPDSGEEEPGGVTVTYDEDGNVYLSGVTVSHDGAGNVVLSGVTATDDGNGNITIT